MSGSRDYEDELLNKLKENGITDSELLACFLCYFSSDDTCACLEDACRTYDIDVDDEEE